MEYYGPEPSGDEVEPVRARELCSIPDLSDLFMGDRPEWQDRAACRETKGAPIEAIRKKAEIFFPTRGESVEPAKQVCDSCEVKKQCLKLGEALDERIWRNPGVWGGLSQKARKKTKAQQNPTS